ncbi:sigma-70 family RNA polymerase sigma factor [Tsukamurella tyrosinosolvens]|uniref:sigma-70 family RNA polymerase sigma factor n=1 Tax=Tsukamurella tyrosinosolvens TaxID=57704 RepID=UPI001CE0942C|nr:sigma-70 family RNA polymerase sigma factor [Tsukamurella tyrosinosolvens]
MTSPPPDLGALFLRHRETMYRVAHATLRGSGREADVEDVVSETIVSLMSRPLVPAENWEALLVTVVRRRALDRIKSAEVKHAGPKLEESHLDHRGRDSDFTDDLVDRIVSSTYETDLKDCMSRLDDRHRDVLWRVVVLEDALGDIAERLGVSRPRISQMRQRALEMLRDCMRRKEEGNE